MDPADAIPAAARLLVANGAPGNLQQAIFAYNHSGSYVTDVLDQAARYAAGGAQAVSAAGSAVCQQAALGPLPAGTAGKILAYAEAQLGKPYVFGAAGPDAFDCSGLAMMAYRAAGITIPRTSQAQWAYGTADPRQPGPAGRPGLLRRSRRHPGRPRARRHRPQPRRPHHDQRLHRRLPRGRGHLRAPGRRRAGCRPWSASPAVLILNGGFLARELLLLAKPCPACRRCEPLVTLSSNQPARHQAAEGAGIDAVFAAQTAGVHPG